MSKKTSGRVGNLLAAFEKKEEPTNQPTTQKTGVASRWPPATSSTQQPVEQPKPVEKKPVEQPKPVVQQQQETKPVEQPKPVEKVQKPVEQPKPVVQQQQQQQPVVTKTVEQPKPVVEKPQETKPVVTPTVASNDEEIDTVALLALVERLEKAAQKLETIKITGSASTGASSSSSGEAVAPQITAFDDYTRQFLQPFLDTLATLGGPLDKAKQLVSDGFNETRGLIEKASKSKKPASDEVLVPHLAPVSKIMDALDNLRMDNRQSPFYNHLYALSEGMKCLAWVSVPNTTVSYVKEMINAAQFYTNKVLVDFRKTENGETHVKFVEQFKEVINELANYIKEHHMTGLKFNPQGGDLSAATSSSAPVVQQETKKAEEPVKKVTAEQPKKAGPPVDLLASINAKKDAAASGLKTVTDDMKTKNRTDRTSVVTEAPNKQSALQKANAKFQGTPKFELEKGVGEKWVVQYIQNNNELVINETSIKQNVYVYRSLNSVITIQGKVKGIVIDGCKKVAVIADSVVSSIEFVNCESVKLQINGEVHTVSVDKTDGFQLYLSKASLGTKLITSKSSEMNINVPSKTDEDDFTEHPVPEQFVTSYDEKAATFSTTVNSVFM